MVRFLKTALFLALSPLIMAAAAIAGLFDKGRDCTSAELAEELRKFADGTEGEWDWDAFESVRLRNPELEKIRWDALRTAMPLTDSDRAKLRRLAEHAAALTP